MMEYLTDPYLQDPASLCNVGKHILKFFCKDFVCVRRVLEFCNKSNTNITNLRLENSARIFIFISRIFCVGLTMQRLKDFLIILHRLNEHRNSFSVEITARNVAKN